VTAQIARVAEVDLSGDTNEGRLFDRLDGDS
jgi:hypothetical protein